MNYLMAFTLFATLDKGITSNFIVHPDLPTTFALLSTPTSSSTLTQFANNRQQQQQHHQSSNQGHHLECGIRPARRQPRKELKHQQQQNKHTNKNNYYDYHQNNNGFRRADQQQQQQKQQKRKRQHANNQFFNNARIPKIIAGSPTKEGHFPWQVSLELLHPSMGFLGHWCGGVLVDEFWVLSASHCVHNDLFNLPLAPLWTVVLGEYDRNVESGFEQRIPVEKIILHQSYQHFLHDLVLMKLAIPADLSKYSNVRKICLPFLFGDNEHNDDDIDEDTITADEDDSSVTKHQSQHQTMMMHITNSINSNQHHGSSGHHHHATKEEENFFPSLEDFLLNMQGRNKINFTLPSMKELMTTKIANFLKRPIKRPSGRRNSKFQKRRNDRFMTGFRAANIATDSSPNDDGVGVTGAVPSNPDGTADSLIVSKFNKNHQQFHHEQHQLHHLHQHTNHDEYKDLPYMDCIATGWGKSNLTGDLSDILLKTNVPLQSNSRCKDAYGGFVKIHKGHLCAGKLNGKGGTCVGDSGGPLQCRLTKNGPWILAGITSFGSGCALEGYPDVYTRTSFYMKWIRNIIENE